MQNQVSTTTLRRALLVMIVICVVILVGCWGAAWADDTSLSSTWKSTERVTVYAGTYAVTARNLRFEPGSTATSAPSLVLDLTYINLSAHTVKVAPNSRIHVLVVDPSGCRVDEYIAHEVALAPGDMKTISIHMASGCATDENKIKPVTVLLTDAGYNIHGQMVAAEAG